MGAGDNSNGPLCSTDVGPRTPPTLKLLHASVALMKCRDLLADERVDEARRELNRAHGVLDELEAEPLNAEQTQELIVLLQLSVRLEARLRLFTMRQRWKR